MPTIGENVFEMCIERLAGKAGAEYRAEKALLRKEFDLSESTLDKISRDYRPSTRKQRSDAGTSRLEATEEEVQGVIDLMIRFDHLTYNRAIDIQEVNGLLRPGVLPEHMLSQIMRRRGLSYKRRHTDVSPANQWDASFPNEFWEFDCSKMEHLHLDPETMRVSYNPRLNYKNSRGEKAAPLWLYLFIDRYSRVEFPRLMVNLHWLNHVEAFRWATTEKVDPVEFPAYGVPKFIRMDNGGGNQSKDWHAALRKLGTRHIPSEASSSRPFGSRVHGLVENPFRFWNNWEKDFQLRESFSWEEAQEFLYQTALRRNRRVHSVTNERPFERWLRIDKPLHAPDEDAFRLLTYRSEPRHVNRYGQIELDRKSYWAKPDVRLTKIWTQLVDEVVMVYWRRDEQEHLIYVAHSSLNKPIECVPVGDVARPAFRPPEPRDPTSVEEARERAKATGTYGNLKLWETDTTAPAYLPRRGEPFDNLKIRLEPPATATPPAPAAGSTPSFLQNRDIVLWRDRYEAVAILRGIDFFGDTALNKEEVTWLNDLMETHGKTVQGKLQIDADKVEAAAKEARAARAAKTGEAIDNHRPFFRGEEE